MAFSGNTVRLKPWVEGAPESEGKEGDKGDGDNAYRLGGEDWSDTIDNP